MTASTVMAAQRYVARVWSTGRVEVFVHRDGVQRQRVDRFEVAAGAWLPRAFHDHGWRPTGASPRRGEWGVIFVERADPSQPPPKLPWSLRRRRDRG